MSIRRIRIAHCIDSFSAGGTELNLIRTIERLDPRLKPDVVHSHDCYTNLFVTPCARLAGVPLVITSRRWWTAMPRPIYRIGNQAAYRLSHRVIANSAAVARLMSECEGVPAARIVTLPNFVDEDAFVQLPDEARLLARRSFGIPDGALVITAVAVFRPEKDLETLIAAMALLRQQHSNLHLLLVGSGPRETALKRAAEAHCVRDHVHFPGFLSSPPNLHQYGDLSVLCSLHEAFPNSVIEAMAAGKPVVGTNVGGIPDAVEEGRTGFLVPPRSSQDLAGSIDCLLADAGLRAAMGEAGRTKARAEYGAAAVIEKLGALYRESLPFSDA